LEQGDLDMKKNLIALMCALILTGFGALAAAEPASVPSAQPSQAVAPAPVAQPVVELASFMSPESCPQTLAGALVPAPTPKAGCAGGETGPCDTSNQCKGYVCHLGEIRWCFGSTGSGCNGWCGCW
jgi:hypothetical protein